MLFKGGAKMVDMIEECKRHNLSTSGKTVMLAKRLKNHYDDVVHGTRKVARSNTLMSFLTSKNSKPLSPSSSFSTSSSHGANPL
jgi:hypothetical protein